MTTEELVMDINNCARCSGRHDRLVFRKLTRPLDDEVSHLQLSHWCTCPSNGEPILMQVHEDETQS